MPTIAFPRTPRDLERGWLTETLRAAGLVDASAVVSDFTLEPLGAGVGMAGELARVRVELLGPAPAPAAFVAKFSTTNPENLRVMLRYGLYAREVHFYRHVAASVPVRVPHCYHTELNDTGSACLLLLEDLGALRVGDQVVGCTADDAHAVVVAMARLHAACRDDQRLAEGLWRADGAQATAKASSFAASWERTRANLGERLPAQLTRAIPAYVDALPGLMQWAAEGVCTLVHGDLRLDNVLFADTAERPEVALIDWQNCQWGNGALDLGYFLTQSLPPELRRAQQERLLEAYRAELGRGGVAVSADDLSVDYRRGALCALSTAITLAGLSLSTGRGTALADAVIARAAAAADDLDLLALL